MAKSYLSTGDYPATAAVNTNAPWDTRQNVDSKTDLIAWDSEANVSATFGKYIYKGMPVIVDGQELYILADTSKINATDYSGWVKVGDGGSIDPTVLNGLAKENTSRAILNHLHSHDSIFPTSVVAQLGDDGEKLSFDLARIELGKFHWVCSSFIDGMTATSDSYSVGGIITVYWGEQVLNAYTIKSQSFDKVAMKSDIPTDYATESSKGAIEGVVNKIHESVGEDPVEPVGDEPRPNLHQKMYMLAGMIGKKGDAELGEESLYAEVETVTTTTNGKLDQILAAVSLTAQQADEDWQNVKPV